MKTPNNQVEGAEGGFIAEGSLSNAGFGGLTLDRGEYMSCQVCHRMICRCGPDLTEALRAQNELHEQIYLLQQRIANSETKISALNSTLESALIAFERIAIGNAFCNPRETAMLMYNEIKQRLSCEETPEMKGPDLTGIERECCGTFHGTPHRSTCKNFNTKTRKRDPFYDDGGS